MKGLVLFKYNLKFSGHLSHFFNVKKAFLLDHGRSVSTSAILQRTVHETDHLHRTTFPLDIPLREQLREGRKLFIEHSKLWLEEVKEKFRQDTKLYQDGDTDVFFRFDSEDSLKNWKVMSDKMNKHGLSECKFFINDKNKAVFCGNLDTSPPKDGKNRYSGYCAIKSLKKKKSFFRDDHYIWDPFTHLELKVKGDGRNYMINLGLGLYFDHNFFDMFSYPIHTRGGPYWEVIRIPFSRFFLTSKGRIQDFQDAVPLIIVDSVGITAAAVSGPFHLEIDYIGCHVDWSHKEKSAYEMYKIPKEYVSS